MQVWLLSDRRQIHLNSIKFQKEYQIGIQPPSLTPSIPCAKDSEIFQEFAGLMSLDLGVQINGVEDLEMLFDSLAELETFRNKKSCVKSGRWFSWQNACQDHFPEFWASRMLLQSLHEDEKSPDDDARSAHTFADLRKDDNGAGGLRLALRCCSWKTWYSVMVLKIGGAPLWHWYSDTVKQVKTASQGLARTLLMSGDQWRSDPQFGHLAKTLQDMGVLDEVLKYHRKSFVHLGQNAHVALRAFGEDLWYYVLGLLGKRGSSLCMYCSPPECYACILHESEDIGQNALQEMAADWKLLKLLEQSSNKKCSEVAADLQLTVSKPMRLVFQLFECGRFSSGKKLMTTLLKRLPDTKLIEDVHQRLRTTSNSNPNSRLGTREVQSLVETSLAFESRRIPHPARLDRGSFKSRWRSTKAENAQSVFQSGSMKLPKKFAGIMARKTWGTMSEETLSRSSCAWMWIRYYSGKSLKDQGVSVQEAWICFSYIVMFSFSIRVYLYRVFVEFVPPVVW